MKIKKILTQSRRDFTALFECEACGVEDERKGYDDTNFHNNVIPTFSCGACGVKGDPDYRPLRPKYSDGIVV